MIGEISIGGVYVPSLLLLGFAALILTGGVVRILSLTGAYRFVAYRALVDPALFIVILGLLALLTGNLGTNQ